MKIILLTGSAGSIGSEIIKNLSKKNKIICVDKNLKELIKLKKKFNKVDIYKCELHKETQVEKLIKIIKNKYKKIDILINNVGKISNEPIIKIGKKGLVSHSYKKWNEIINANLNSVFLISSKIIKVLCSSRSKGLIINISSVSAKGNIGQSGYSSAKAAVEILTKIWADELKSFGIRVACIAPGFFNTESTKRALNRNQLIHLKRVTPSNRLGRPSEIISAIKFLIQNDFFNGKILNLDGGLNL